MSNVFILHRHSGCAHSRHRSSLSAVPHKSNMRCRNAEALYWGQDTVAVRIAREQLRCVLHCSRILTYSLACPVCRAALLVTSVPFFSPQSLLKQLEGVLPMVFSAESLFFL